MSDLELFKIVYYVYVHTFSLVLYGLIVKHAFHCHSAVTLIVQQDPGAPRATTREYCTYRRRHTTWYLLLAAGGSHFSNNFGTFVQGDVQAKVLLK